jgi:hypothetical protein
MFRQLMAAALLAQAAAVFAGTPTPEECWEGGEFIRNAALSREAGMAREAFLERMESDFQLIRNFPPDLRWFVKDRDDELFLLAAASRVFDEPVRPMEHEGVFLAACFSRAAGISAASDAPANPMPPETANLGW